MKKLVALLAALEEKMKRNGILAFAVGLAGGLTLSAGVVATPGSGFTAVQQWKGVFDSIDVKNETDSHELELRTKGLSDIYVTATPSPSAATAAGTPIPARASSS